MSWTFMLGAAVLCVVALGFVLLPLLRARQPGAAVGSVREANRQVHSERLAELERDLTEGILTGEQYDHAVADLERDLVETGVLDADTARRETRSWGRMGPFVPLATIAVGVVVVPVASGVLYLAVGNPEAQRLSVGAQAETRGEPPVHDTEQFGALTARLRDRLEREPEDVGGWMMLARTHVFLGQNERALEAFALAVDHGGNRDPDVLAEYADLIADESGQFSEQSVELIHQALELDPDHVLALWLAGTAAFENADYTKAREYWEPLDQLLAEDSNLRQTIRANLEELDARSKTD